MNTKWTPQGINKRDRTQIRIKTRQHTNWKKRKKKKKEKKRKKKRKTRKKRSTLNATFL